MKTWSGKLAILTLALSLLGATCGEASTEDAPSSDGQKQGSPDDTDNVSDLTQSKPLSARA